MNKTLFAFVILGLFTISACQDAFPCHFYTQRECKYQNDCIYRNRTCFDRYPVDGRGQTVPMSELSRICDETRPADRVCPSFCKLNSNRSRCTPNPKVAVPLRKYPAPIKGRFSVKFDKEE